VNRKSLTLAKTQRFPDPTPGFQYFFSTYFPYQFGFFDPAGVIPFLQGVYANLPQLNLTPRNPNPNPFLVKSLYYQSIATGAAFTNPPVPNINQHKVPFQPGYTLTLQQKLPALYPYQGQINQAKATWFQQLKQNDLLRSQIANDIVTSYESVLLSRSNILRYQNELLPAAS